MKKTLIAVVMLLVVACGGPERKDGMTAGEEVIWMNDWMERHYGQMLEGDYEWEKYEVQAERVFEYMDSTIFAYHYPAVPDDLMEYFAGVPDDMVSVSQYHGDHAAARQEVATFWERIGMLQKYADGKSEYFPAEEIMTEVGHLLNTHLDLTSHSGYNAPEEYSYLVLAFRMVQQLVRLCPDIGMIADSMADDVGVLTLSAPCFFSPYGVILFPDETGIYVPVLVEHHLTRVLEAEDPAVPHYEFYAEDYHGHSSKVFSVARPQGKWSRKVPLPFRHDFWMMPDAYAPYLMQSLEDGTAQLPDKVLDDTSRVFPAIRELDRYVRGERKFYPAEQVRKAIDFWGFAIDWAYNHGAFEDGDSRCLNTYLRFLNYAASNATDINFITDQVSADHNAGVITYSRATSYNFSIFAVYRSVYGNFGVKLLYSDISGEQIDGYDAPYDITHVRKIGPDDAGMYLYSNETPYYFMHCLCWYGPDGEEHFFMPKNRNVIHEQWITEDIRSRESFDDFKVVYNPKKVCWNICTSVNKTWQPVSGSKTLYLDLDGLASSYRVE